MSLKDNFSDSIFLSHFKFSKWNQIPNSFSFEDKILNRLCGDEIRFFINTNENSFGEIFFYSESCSISKVSTSILLEEIQNQKFKTVLELIREFKKDFLEKNKTSSNLNYLFKFKELPTRKECVLLPFHFIENFILGELKNGAK